MLRITSNPVKMRPHLAGYMVEHKTTQNSTNERNKKHVHKGDLITLTLLFESISRSATRESNFSCETSGISGLKLKLFFNSSTLPVKHITKIHIKYTYRPLNISQSINRDFRAD